MFNSLKKSEAKLTVFLMALAFFFISTSQALAIYDPEGQADCTPTSTETVCITRTATPTVSSSTAAVLSVTEAIIKAPITLAEKVSFLQTILEALKTILGKATVDDAATDDDHTYSYDGGEVTLNNGKYSFNIGCNIISGTYERDGGKITFNPGASTLKACDADLMDKDAKLVKDLEKITTIEEVDGDIILSGKDLSLVLQSEKVTYEYEGGTATFANGQYSFKIGCNTIFGTYEQDREKVALSQGASTLMACEADLMKKDEQLVKDLAKVTTMKKDGQNLILSGGGVTLKLVAKPVK